jgi:hypothetical protein
LLFTGCKEKYTPKVTTPISGFLVVEGIINAGNGPTTMRLTRASGLDSIHMIYEEGAEIEVQSSDGASYPLAEQGNGLYTISQVPVMQNLQYRVHIKTSNGGEYLSDFGDAKISPPIDSLSWEATPEQVRIDVTTHDAGKNSVYYQWEYDETWKYVSAFQSEFIVDSLGNDRWSVVARPDSLKRPFTCWRTDTSTRIIIASSAKLNEDVVAQFPITFIPFSASNRLIQRYTINVKQFVLDKDGYEWKQKVQKNTEQLGSIFDAQPSETGGNIHSVTNPAERVIGFIGCSSITEKRIFIDHSQLPLVTVNTGYQDCEQITRSLFEKFNPLPDLYEQPNDFAISGVTRNSADIIDSVKITPMECVDCRLRGGVDYPPPFWQ